MREVLVREKGRARCASHSVAATRAMCASSCRRQGHTTYNPSTKVNLSLSLSLSYLSFRLHLFPSQPMSWGRQRGRLFSSPRKRNFSRSLPASSVDVFPCSLFAGIFMLLYCTYSLIRLTVSISHTLSFLTLTL